MSYRKFTNKLCQLCAGSKFTKFLHDIESSSTLLMCTLMLQYPIPFQNAKATKEGSLPFSTKLVAMATSLEISKKICPDRSSAPKTLSFSEKTAKIGEAYPEIIIPEQSLKKEEKNKEINASKISLDMYGKEQPLYLWYVCYETCTYVHSTVRVKSRVMGDPDAELVAAHRYLPLSLNSTSGITNS